MATHRPDQSPFAAAAAAASGEVAIVLDEAMTLDEGSSIAEVAALLHDEDVATVGTAQFRPDGCVRHGGLVVQGGTAAPILHGWHRDHGGPGRVMDVNREVTAVDLVGSAWHLDDLRTVAPLADGRSDGIELGVRACLAARAEGRRVLWTPFTSFTRCDQRHRQHDRRRTIDTPEHDPYYNPNLVAGRADWLELTGTGGSAALHRRRRAANATGPDRSPPHGPARGPSATIHASQPTAGSLTISCRRQPHHQPTGTHVVTPTGRRSGLRPIGTRPPRAHRSFDAARRRRPGGRGRP